MQKKAFVLLLTILALGAFLRLYQLASLPPGLYPDEAMNGSNGQEAWANGQLKIFYPENNGREGLFINIQAVSVHLFGNTPWALRVVSALFGTLTILGIYLAAKELFRSSEMEHDTDADSLFGIRRSACIALLSAFFLATSYWHLNFSRMGFRAITTPFFAAFGIYFLLKGLRRNAISDLIFGGIFIGLGFHGYIAFRFMPFVLTPPLLYYLRQWWKNRRESGHGCGPCAVTLFVFVIFVSALPIGMYFLQNRADFIGRGGQVSIFSAVSPTYEFLKSNALTAGMFFIRGDCNARHNYACAPELLWPVAIFFLIGLGTAIFSLVSKRESVRQFRFAGLTLLSWFSFMTLPVTLTREGVPHALRAIGLIPPVMIMAGWGTYTLLAAIMRRFGTTKQSRNVIRIGFALLLIFIAHATWRTYFITWGKSREARDAFAHNLIELGSYLAKLPDAMEKYVIVNLNGTDVRGIPMPAQTVMFLTDTFRAEGRALHRTHYILPHQLDQVVPAPNMLIAPLEANDPNLIAAIQKKFPELQRKTPGEFTIIAQ